MLLKGTADLLKLITTAGATVDVHISWVDNTANSPASTPDRLNQVGITTAVTTTVAGSPGASTFRRIKNASVRNRHASASCDCTMVHFDGTLSPEMFKVTLAAGEQLIYTGKSWQIFDALGRFKQRVDSLLAPSSPAYTTVVLTGDVTNSNATPNTIADVTGLKFAAVAGNTYWFLFFIAYTAAATGTGSRWCINGPAITTLILGSEYSLTTTTRTVNEGISTYDAPAACNATSAATAANTAWIEGIIKTSANGDVIARFASEVAGSAIIAKAGSILRYQQVL